MTPPPTPTQTIAPTTAPTPTLIPTSTPVTSFADIDGHWGEAYINTLAALGVLHGYPEAEGIFGFKPDKLIQRQEFAKIVAVAFGIYDPSAPPIPYPFPIYTDCPLGAWFTPYVDSLADGGLTKGMGDGTFGVGLNMSRQDTATMLARAMVKYQAAILPNFGEAATAVLTFADAAYIEDYAKPAIAFFVNENIIMGYETSVGSGILEFRPGANITRAEISKIMCMSLDYVAPTPTPTVEPT
jgi:hypothetical protein